LAAIGRAKFARCIAAPPPAPENPTPVEAIAWRLRTPQSKQLYGLRKPTPEPVFGIGTLRALAVASAMRLEALPNIRARPEAN
jgi:hypothetical protein